MELSVAFAPMCYITCAMNTIKTINRKWKKKNAITKRSTGRIRLWLREIIWLIKQVPCYLPCLFHSWSMLNASIVHNTITNYPYHSMLTTWWTWIWSFRQCFVIHVCARCVCIWLLFLLRTAVTTIDFLSKIRPMNHLLCSPMRIITKCIMA